MKSLVRLILLLVVVGGVGLYILSQRNNTSFTPQTIDLAVDCSDLNKLLVTSAVNVDVRNLSSRSHNGISVKITAYDGAGNVLKEKSTMFTRTLAPHSQFDKPVTLPAQTERCDCKITSSHPEL